MTLHITHKITQIEDAGYKTWTLSGFNRAYNFAAERKGCDEVAAWDETPDGAVGKVWRQVVEDEARAAAEETKWNGVE